MAGQRCTANRRAVVDASCLTEFVTYLARAAARLRFGDPLKEDTQVGPLISIAAARRVASAVERAKDLRFKALAPHRDADQDDECLECETFYPPTIIICEDPESEIVQHETFGPVLVIQPCKAGITRWNFATACVRVSRPRSFHVIKTGAGSSFQEPGQACSRLIARPLTPWWICRSAGGRRRG